MQLKEFSLISPAIESGTVLKVLETAIPAEAISRAIADTHSNEERKRALPTTEQFTSMARRRVPRQFWNRGNKTLRNKSVKQGVFSMRLTKEQVESYNENGFLLIANYFSKAEVDYIMTQLPSVFAEDTPRRVLENSGAVRTVLAPHTTNKVFQLIPKLSKLVEPAMQLLGSKVYVHQYKINVKEALEGEQWEWHQDFLYWHKEDGMPTAQALSIAIFLQEANDFNGPLLFIPGSHKEGMIDLMIHEKYLYSRSWTPTFTADLKYKIDKNILKKFLKDNKIVAAKGSAGTAVFFHSNVLHASANNISADARNSIFIVYNSIENPLVAVENPRPEFIANRDFSPVASVPDNALFEELIETK